jgi:hypothetical protein
MRKIPRLAPVTSLDDVPAEKKVPDMVRVPAAKPIVGVVICETIFSLPTHWDGSFTVICSGPGQCDLCPNVGLKPYFLLGVWDRNESIAKWVQLTSYAARSLLNQIQELQVPLYGLTVRIARERPTMKAPITCVIDRYATVQGRLPKPIDPQETIERVFGSPKTSRKPKLKAV